MESLIGLNGNSFVGKFTVPPNSVNTDAIQTDAVTQAKIADDAVGTDQLIDESVTPDKLDPTVAGPGLEIYTIANSSSSAYTGQTLGGLKVKVDEETLTIDYDTEEVKVSEIDENQFKTKGSSTGVIVYNSGVAEFLQPSSANDVLKYSGTALAFQASTDVGYVLLREMRSDGVQGLGRSTGLRTSTGYDWYARTLTEKTQDTNAVCQLSATNTIPSSSPVSYTRFTLTAGTYEIDSVAMTMGALSMITRLYDVTNSATILYGTEAHSYAEYAASPSIIKGRFTITATTTFELQQCCANFNGTAAGTTQNTKEFGGNRSSYGNLGVGTNYALTMIEFKKISN